LFNEVFDFKPTKGVTGIRLRAPWGVWRNAGDVPLDYEPDQVMHAAATPSTFHVEGKRRSAIEIVACVIGGNRDCPPDAERAIAILKSVFELNPARE
jgi:hypothetical protein